MTDKPLMPGEYAIEEDRAATEETLLEANARGFRQGRQFDKAYPDNDATIERCAQVAYEMAPEPDGAPDGVWTKTDTKLLTLCNEIVAAIRALKDKP